MSYFAGAGDMAIIRLSTKGQVVIPKAVRAAHRWEEGQELEVVDTPAGVLLRVPSAFAATTLDEVAGCLKGLYQGPAVSVEDMHAAIDRAMQEDFR